MIMCQKIEFWEQLFSVLDDVQAVEVGYIFMKGTQFFVSL